MRSVWSHGALRTIHLLVCLFILLALFGCSNEDRTVAISETWYKQHATELEAIRVPCPSDGRWEQVTDVAVVRADRTVVLDNGLGGAYLAVDIRRPPRRIVSFGQGAGELVSFQTAVATSHGFCIADGGIRRILRFDDSGSYREECENDGPPLGDLAAVSCDWVATPTPNPIALPTTFAVVISPEESHSDDGRRVPYPKRLASASYSEVSPALHSWRVASAGDSVYFVSAGLPLLVRSTSEVYHLRILTIEDEYEQRIMALHTNAGVDTADAMRNTDIDVDETGTVFVARSGAWGLRADGEWAYRIDVFDPELNPIAVLVVANHPDRISARDGLLVVGSLATPNGEWPVQAYEYRSVLSEL